LLVALLGMVFSLAANQISPRGLALTRHYFPGATRPGSTLTTGNAMSQTGLLSERLRAKGLQLVDSNQVVKLFRDPRYAQELIVFVDARDDRHYEQGHVPGAYQLDHYRRENYLAAVVLVCQTADQVVVYCHGGDCEDSVFAAITLSEAGIPKAKLFVYGGGLAEWTANGLPIEIGPRQSGNLRNVSPGALPNTVSGMK
jgi:rhodanese-related sulfurtransferase